MIYNQKKFYIIFSWKTTTKFRVKILCGKKEKIVLVDQLIKPNDRAISDSGSDFVAHENFTIHIKSIPYCLVNEGN